MSAGSGRWGLVAFELMDVAQDLVDLARLRRREMLGFQILEIFFDLIDLIHRRLSVRGRVDPTDAGGMARMVILVRGRDEALMKAAQLPSLRGERGRWDQDQFAGGNPVEGDDPSEDQHNSRKDLLRHGVSSKVNPSLDNAKLT